MNVVYAYALDEIDQEARAHGTSIIDARQSFEKALNGPASGSERESTPAKVRQEREAQQQLLSLMGKAGRG